jgi:hypothetical protein
MSDNLNDTDIKETENGDNGEVLSISEKNYYIRQIEDIREDQDLNTQFLQEDLKIAHDERKGYAFVIDPLSLNHVKLIYQSGESTPSGIWWTFVIALIIGFILGFGFNFAYKMFRK